MAILPFTELAGDATARVDELALALATALREDVDADRALARLDELGREVEFVGGDDLDALHEVLGRRYGFIGNREEYDHPDNSMLDLVLQRRTGLPIVLSVVYVAVARRAGIALHGVGLAGHYVVGRFEHSAPELLDPFAGGTRITGPPPAAARPWSAHETALRMLNNLVGSYTRRSDLGRAIRAAELRLELPLERALAETVGAELRALRARLN
jgi:regulator of sirC expression with transglutaminase-like and TPR domain